MCALSKIIDFMEFNILYHYRKLYRLGFGVAVLIALVLLLLPGSLVQSVEFWLNSWLHFAADFEDTNQVGYTDKVVHAVLFALIGLLAARGWADNRRHLAVVLLGCVCLALLTEFLQTWVPDRDSNWADGVANLLGLTLGAIAGRSVFIKQAIPIVKLTS